MSERKMDSAEFRAAVCVHKRASAEFDRLHDAGSIRRPARRDGDVCQRNVGREGALFFFVLRVRIQLPAVRVALADFLATH
jgi:hypothetical protein